MVLFATLWVLLCVRITLGKKGNEGDVMRKGGAEAIQTTAEMDQYGAGRGMMISRSRAEHMMMKTTKIIDTSTEARDIVSGTRMAIVLMIAIVHEEV